MFEPVPMTREVTKEDVLGVVDFVFRDTQHCAGCAWVALAAFMVLWGCDLQLEVVWDAEVPADDDEDDEWEDREERVDEAQERIRAGFALRLYDVVDGAMRQRWGNGLQVPIVRDTLSVDIPPWQELANAGVQGGKRRAVEIVDSVMSAASSSADALECIAVCAVLSGIYQRNDVSVAVRTYALTSMVEEARIWLLEGADLVAAVAEAGLLMSDGSLPSPELEHDP